eukprot:scaffold57785_cov36-Phaeocystis_antarctica.AAC.1
MGLPRTKALAAGTPSVTWSIFSNLTRPDISTLHRAAAEVAHKGSGEVLGPAASWSVSDSSRYIRSRAQYAAKWRVVVKVEPPKGPEGLTRHYEVSPSQHMAAETGGWRRTASRSVSADRRF